MWNTNRMSAPLPDAVGLVAGLEAAAVRVVIVAAGGGSEAVSHLATCPGASGVVLEASVASARAAVDGWLGGAPEAYCSSRTARLLAMAAWQRARALALHDMPPTEAVAAACGVAVTAGLRTRRAKRGDHRVFVAVQRLAATRVAALVFEKDARSRAEEERVAAALVLAMLSAETGGPDHDVALIGRVRGGERVCHDRCEAAPEWRDLLAGTRAVSAAVGGAALPAAGALVFPGSFNPLHEGHRRMAVLAEEIAERPVEYELSITNVDKPTLDYVEIADRVAPFAAAEDAARRRLWLTRAATFLDKIEIFPESTFVMGADTYARLADPRYYGGSAEAAGDALRRIAAGTRGLIVFGRERNGEFLDAARLDVPDALRCVTYFVSQREFRMDISSTQLRRARLPADD